MIRHAIRLLTFAAVVPVALAQAPTMTKLPPRTWVDKDTGHRIVRLSDEPNSSGFYFNVNAYTPDLKTMIYTAPDGIHAMDMATRKTKLLVPNPPRPADADQSSQFRFGGVHAIIAGRKANSVF